MSRARNIKPGFFKNEDLAECSPWTRLCFAGLWMMADRDGRLEDRPKRIKGELFPYDNVEVEPMLQELARYGFVERYEVNGTRVIAIPKFKDHQRPHPKEKPSELPGHDGVIAASSDDISHENVDTDLDDDEEIPVSAVKRLDPAVKRLDPAVKRLDPAVKRLVLARTDVLNPDVLNPDVLNPEESFVGTFRPEKNDDGEKIPIASPKAPPATRSPPDPKPALKSGRGTRLLDDWQLPKAWGDWALQERGDLNVEDVRREAACFADYWHAKAGANARKADWEATWRNWIRKADQRGKGGFARSPPSRRDRYAEQSRQIAEMSARADAEMLAQMNRMPTEIDMGVIGATTAM